MHCAAAFAESNYIDNCMAIAIAVANSKLLVVMMFNNIYRWNIHDVATGIESIPVIFNHNIQSL